MSTGCRSGKSNLFSFRGEPSPEALAGNGPTTTYPVPPSATATPEAIDSVAAGTGVAPNSPLTTPVGVQTATAQVAGLGGTPGYVKPASTNLSAAQANGFHGGTPAGYKTPAAEAPSMDGLVPGVKAPKTSTSGYQFGTNPQANSAGASSYTMPSSYTPPAAKAAATPAATPAVAKAGGPGGFTMPTDLGGAVTTAGGASGCTDCAGCDACKDSSSGAPLPTKTPAGSSSYSPGSTAEGVDYPAPNATFLR